MLPWVVTVLFVALLLLPVPRPFAETDLQSCDVNGLLAGLDRSQLVLLLEALLRHDDEPALLDRLPAEMVQQAKVLGGWGPRNVSCVARRAGEFLKFKGFSHRAALVTGHLRSWNVFERQLQQLCEVMDLVVFVSWKRQFDMTVMNWLLNVSMYPPGKCCFQYVELDRLAIGRDDSYADFVDASDVQDYTLRAGFSTVRLYFPKVPSTDILVLKTRTDVYLPPATLDHILRVNYSIAAEHVARPFVHRLWISWFDALQPLLLADDLYAGSLLDLRQLLWPISAMNTVPVSMGSAAFHIYRWLLPFLPWHPLLHAYRRNMYDITHRLFDERSTTVLDVASPSCASTVLAMFQKGQLPGDVRMYLLRLLVLYYQLLTTFFLVGRPGSAPAAHLIVDRNANLSWQHGRWHLSSIRCRPGNWAFRVAENDNFTFSPALLDDAGNPCTGGPADVSAGLMRISDRAKHSIRDSSSLDWVHRVMSGQAGQDGLSEHVASLAAHEPLRPLHFTSTAGAKAAQRYGRHDEVIVTDWCSEVALEYGVEGNIWQQCCGDLQRGELSHCWASGSYIDPAQMTNWCCFPKEAKCPPWMVQTFFNKLVNLAIINQHARKTEEAAQIVPALAEDPEAREMFRDTMYDVTTTHMVSLFCDANVHVCELPTEFERRDYLSKSSVYMSLLRWMDTEHWMRVINLVCPFKHVAHAVYPQLAPKRFARRHMVQPELLLPGLAEASGRARFHLQFHCGIGRLEEDNHTSLQPQMSR